MEIARSIDYKCHYVISVYWSVTSCRWLLDISCVVDDSCHCPCFTIKFTNHAASWFFPRPKANDSTVSAYLQHAKMLFDELAAAGRPLSMEDFNLYVFCGLRGEFRYLVTTLSTRAEPVSYTDLHSLLLTHEFLHKASLQPVVAATLLLTPSQPPSAFFSQRQPWSPGNHYNQNSGRRGRFRGGWKTHNHGYLNCRGCAASRRVFHFKI